MRDVIAAIKRKYLTSFISFVLFLKALTTSRFSQLELHLLSLSTTGSYDKSRKRLLMIGESFLSLAAGEQGQRLTRAVRRGVQFVPQYLEMMALAGEKSGRGRFREQHADICDRFENH